MRHIKPQLETIAPGRPRTTPLQVFDRTLAMCQDPPSPGIPCIRADEIEVLKEEKHALWPSDVLERETACEVFESFRTRNGAEHALPKLEMPGVVLVTAAQLFKTAATRDCGRGYSQFSLPGYSTDGHAVCM